MINKEVIEHEGKLWLIHRSIPEAQMTPRQYGYNIDDVNGMVRVWASWLKDNNKTIDKVLLKQHTFLFCEEIQDIIYED